MRPVWPGYCENDVVPARVLAFVGFVGDWELGAERHEGREPFQEAHRPETFWRTQVSVLEMNMTKARELYDEARRAGFPQARNLWLRLQLLFADRSDSI